MATANRPRRLGRTVIANDDYEAALRSLPEAHSLALRLHDAGVADDVISGYLHIEPEGLDTLLDLARRKLQAALDS
jgi:DNA-directed RNA polymerase specialized sigma24 family protein